jgi:cysteine desulfurase/selenocysteine lyase
MTIEQLHGDEALRQHEFPVVAKGPFLAHAGVCALPRRVGQAMAQYATACQESEQEVSTCGQLIADVRARLARLLGGQPEEMALVGPTSLALSYVAAGLPWRKGDNVLVYYDDYPSNVYPWMALADRGVEVRFLNVRELGKVRAVDVQGQVDEQTRLVSLAGAHYLAGWRINVDAIGKFLRSRRILFCLDAIQTLGAFPLSVEHVDFLAADAHKWMLGPCAAGVLYVRREVQARLKPIVHGWHNLDCPDFLTQEDLKFKPDARKYEVGSHNLVGLAGFQAALGLLEEVGIRNIGAELTRKRAWVAADLLARGFTVLQPDPPPENVGGVLSFFRPDMESAELIRRLEAARVTATIRKLPDGQSVVRFSPHFYNTDEELRVALAALG